jgi:uncharacterized membrane protein YfcA
MFHPGNIVWWMAVMMAVTACLGALVGSSMAHRVGRRTVRFLVIGVGFALTAWYFYKMHGI